MNASATKFGVNTAALAVVAATAVIPMQAATAAPVSSYANQWSQTVGSAFSDLATAPAFLSDPAAAPWFCFGGSECLTADSTVIFSLNVGNFLSGIPGLNPAIINLINQFAFTSCVFGRCIQFGPYETES